MKNKFILIFLGIIISCSLANALDVSIENYYPTPAEAGGYFNVWLQIVNRENSPVEGAAIRFKEVYPFSLDPGEESEIKINKLELGSAFTQKFKVRVDKESKEGDNNLVFEYKECAGCVWQEKNFPITVTEFQTTFDVVLQEVSTEGVFIAIANIGKNPANAITVSIPEQEYFKTELISASIVGNLESGDYTIVSFKVVPEQNGIKSMQDLKIQISYTDTFGARRTVTKSISLNPSTLNMMGSNVDATAIRNTNSKSSVLKNVWFWVSLALTGIIIFMVRKRFKKSKN